LTAQEEEAQTNLVTSLVAGGAGIAAGNGMVTATSAAGMETLYNRQLRDNEKKAIAERARGDKDEQERLTKAACLAVKCWAEYKPGSDEYNSHYVTQPEAAHLQAEIDWVNRQKEAGLFNYTPVQKIGDAVISDPVGVAKDVAKVVVGGVTAKTGAGLCTTGAGCIPGTGMIAFGMSDMTEGAEGLYNRYNGIDSPGVNPLRWGFNQTLPAGWGNITYDGLNVVTAILALKTQVPLKMGVADGLNRPGSMFDVMVPNINNNRLIPFVNKALPYGANQTILLFGVGSKGATVINDIRHIGGEQ
jgi:filamentous hemagglutinin